MLRCDMLWFIWINYFAVMKNDKVINQDFLLISELLKTCDINEHE
jgi:hypothetical protein